LSKLAPGTNQTKWSENPRTAIEQRFDEFRKRANRCAPLRPPFDRLDHRFAADRRYASHKFMKTPRLPFTLDTGAEAFYAKWSADSREVAIRYRIDRREARMVRYRIENGRAKLLSGPVKVAELRFK
jgi:hypothetical protein